MFIQLPEPECSKCVSQNSETFQRGNISGRRCLSCGHEQTQEITTTGYDSGSITYTNPARHTF